MNNDTLQRIKKRVNIDQRNLVTARVLSVGSNTARVRLPDGSERTVYAAGNYLPGNQVTVELAGRTAAIKGSALLQRTGGMKSVEIT